MTHTETAKNMSDTELVDELVEATRKRTEQAAINHYARWQNFQHQVVAYANELKNRLRTKNSRTTAETTKD